jgi:predicted RNA binding protein YcfA (HicA-like mRNA interferase family)
VYHRQIETANFSARFLERHGFVLARTKGSHRIFVRGHFFMVIAYRRPFVHPAAVREALALIDQIEDQG